MIFDFVSDIHEDQNPGNSLVWEHEKNPGVDTLVIAGDTSNFWQNTLDVVAGAANVYQNVIFVDGNHDHYNTGLPVTEAMDFFNYEVRRRNLNNVVYLDGYNECRFGDVVFIGANGWYDFRAYPEEFTVQKVIDLWRSKIGDGKSRAGSDKPIIDFGDFGLPDELARYQAAQLAAKVQAMQDDEMVREIIIITHTAPNIRLLKRTNDPEWDAITGCYLNSAMEGVVALDKNQKIKVWCYGHTHFRGDTTIGHIRYVNNARGYGFEDGRWWMASVDTEDKSPW